MSSISAATIETWMAQNTRTCPLGRISEENCRRNRERPTMADIAHGNAKAPKRRWGGGNHLPRPHECEGCTLWKEGATMKEIIVKEMDGSLDTCEDCGIELKPWKQGSVTIKRVCKSCHDARKKRGTKVRPKRPVLHVDFTGHEELLEALIEKARREFRTPESQILAMIREIHGS